MEADQQSCNISTDGSSYQNFSYFNKYQDLNETPFDSSFDDSFEEDILNSVNDLSSFNEFFGVGAMGYWFQSLLQDEVTEYISEGSDDSECEELKKDFVEETPNVETGNLLQNSFKVYEIPVIVSCKAS